MFLKNKYRFIRKHMYSANRFICRVLAVLIYVPRSNYPFLKTADNFCEQARNFAHVTFATLRRNRSVAALLQKNIYEFVRFSSQDWSGQPVAPRRLRGASWSLLRSSWGSPWVSGWIFWPNLNKNAISAKWACLKMSGMLVFQKWKPLQGAS